MGLRERFYDRLGFVRANTIEDMLNNKSLKENDVVKVAETGYFYDIRTVGTLELANGLFAVTKRNTLLQSIINNTNELIQHISNMATPLQNGHMSAEDKKKLDSLGKVEINSSVNAEPNTIAERDSRGSLKSTSFKSENLNENRIDGAIAFRVNNSTDNEIRFCSDINVIKKWLGIKELTKKTLWQGSITQGTRTGGTSQRVSIQSDESFANYDFIEFYFSDGKRQVLRYQDGTVGGNFKDNKNIVMASEAMDIYGWNSVNYASVRLGFYNNREIVFWGFGVNQFTQSTLIKIVGFKFG